jgi:hypothetical protein
MKSPAASGWRYPASTIGKSAAQGISLIDSRSNCEVYLKTNIAVLP